MTTQSFVSTIDSRALGENIQANKVLPQKAALYWVVSAKSTREACRLSLG
ncbi:MAG: hypothetical protein ACI9SC_002173, partial [Gammaproteobacteria bacterium]